MDPSSSQSAASSSRNASDVQPMLVDEGRKSPVASSSPKPGRSTKSPVVVKQELTLSPASRLSRLPKLLPRPTTQPITFPRVAISSHNNTTSITYGQDVPLFVNNSTLPSSSVSRSVAHANYLGPNVPSSPVSINNHGLTQRRKRPRTSNLVFSPSSNGAITSMDLPKSLPPAPSTAPRQEQAFPELAESQFSNFDQVRQNYINMLNQKNEADLAVNSEASAMNLQASEVQDILNAILQGDFPSAPLNAASPLTTSSLASSPGIGMLASPETPDLSTSPDFNDFEDFLVDTPLIAEDDFLTGMAESEPLFPPMPGYEEESSPNIDYTLPHFGAPAEKVQVPNFNTLYTFTPETPMLHDFGGSINPSSLVRSPAAPMGATTFSSPAMLPSSSPLVAPRMGSRKSSATGTRKGLTPEALVPIDAPTQPRKYVTPSATSKKDLPATFARKRARSTAFGDEDEDHLEPLGPNATELEQIEYKRRQNTIAARRSRARKLQHQQELETKIDELTREKDVWKERALMCQQMLVAHGIRAPSFED